MRQSLDTRAVFFRWWIALLMLAAVYLASAIPVRASSPEEGPNVYSARVLLREGQDPARPVGGVSAAEGWLRLDMDLGEPGVFHVILRPDRNVLYVVSDNLEAYVSVPLREGGHGLDDLAEDLAASVMPFGVPVLSLHVDRGENLGEAAWQGYAARRTEVRFTAEFMGNAAGLDAVLWENPAFAPLPLRVEELQRDKDGAVRTGDVVELADIVPAVFSEPERAALFEPPSGLTRYASILDLLLYALAV